MADRGERDRSSRSWDVAGIALPWRRRLVNEAIVTLGVLAALIWFTVWLIQGSFGRWVENRRQQRAHRRQREQMTRAWLIKHWESERIAQTYADDFVEWEREWSEHHGRSER